MWDHYCLQNLTSQISYLKSTKGVSQIETLPVAKASGDRFRRELLWSTLPLWPRIEDRRGMKEISLINSGWRQVSITSRTLLFTLANFHSEIQAATENCLLRQVLGNITKLADTFQEKNATKIS